MIIGGENIDMELEYSLIENTNIYIWDGGFVTNKKQNLDKSYQNLMIPLRDLLLLEKVLLIALFPKLRSTFKLILTMKGK